MLDIGFINSFKKIYKINILKARNQNKSSNLGSLTVQLLYGIFGIDPYSILIDNSFKNNFAIKGKRPSRVSKIIISIFRPF